MTPQVIDGFLPADAYDELRNYVRAQPMRYGSKSNSRTDPHGHWSWKPVYDSRHNLADLTGNLPQTLLNMWNKHIKARFKEPLCVIRCYANGYTYGTDGYFHTDSTRADEQTIIIYICDEWDMDWGGETIVKMDPSDHRAVLPRPNRAFIVPSSAMHAARAVSRKCTSLRLTLMYKTRPRRSEQFEKLSTFLVAHGALHMKHKDGSLHDHLVRVHQLLEDKKLEPGVALGGGLHSVYGTNAYADAAIKADAFGRSLVAAFAGAQAEALAYLFSILDRPKTLEAGGPNLQLRYDATVPVVASLLRRLQLIEAANLLDQGSLDKWPILKGVWHGQA